MLAPRAPATTQSGEAVSERDSGNEMSNATGRTSAAQVRSASAPRQSFAFDYRMYHDVDDLASDKDSRDKRAEARAKARETAANLVATRDAPARSKERSKETNSGAGPLSTKKSRRAQNWNSGVRRQTASCDQGEQGTLVTSARP